MPELLTYAKFFTHDEARPLAELLERASITVSIEKERNQIDSIYIGETLDPMIALKIPAEDFTKANEVVASYTGDASFAAPDETYTPERLKKEYIIAGYVFSILIGFVGIFWGLSVITSKKVLKNGERVSLYDDHTKMHGRIMMAISAFNLFLFLSGKMWQWFTLSFHF